MTPHPHRKEGEPSLAALVEEALSMHEALHDIADEADDDGYHGQADLLHSAANLLKRLASLAAPVVAQEPRAWMVEGVDPVLSVHRALILSLCDSDDECIPLYAGPTLQARVPLTLAQQLELFNAAASAFGGGNATILGEFASRLIEATERAHGITAALGAASLAVKEKTE